MLNIYIFFTVAYGGREKKVKPMINFCIRWTSITFEWFTHLITLTATIVDSSINKQRNLKKKKQSRKRKKDWVTEHLKEKYTNTISYCIWVIQKALLTGLKQIYFVIHNNKSFPCVKELLADPFGFFKKEKENK